MKKKRNVINSGLLLKITILVVLVIGYALIEAFQDDRQTMPGRVHVTLASCIDGDTAHVYLNNKKEKVRFIAVDSPELRVDGVYKPEPYAVKASEYTCDALQSAKSIELYFDAKADERDKFGRLIAWVYVDGVLLQENLVKEGYAKVRYIYDDYEFVDTLNALQKKAKKEKKGIWKLT